MVLIWVSALCVKVYGYNGGQAWGCKHGLVTGRFTGHRDLVSRAATSLYLNAAAFAAPSQFQLGNTVRALDWLRGFSGKSESLSLAKRIPITEKVRAVLRADAQNPFNFVRWSNASTTITSSTFGKVTGAAGGRTIQLNATVEF